MSEGTVIQTANVSPLSNTAPFAWQHITRLSHPPTITRRTIERVSLDVAREGDRGNGKRKGGSGMGVRSWPAGTALASLITALCYQSVLLDRIVAGPAAAPGTGAGFTAVCIRQNNRLTHRVCILPSAGTPGGEGRFAVQRRGSSRKVNA